MASNFNSIKNDIQKHTLAPVYFIHGEEGYFSDLIVEMFENYLPEADRPFNLFTLYAIEKDPEDVMDICRRYPMMADKLVVIVKEIQNAGGGKWANKLAPYAASPSPSTVLVVIARGAKIACKEFTDSIKKGGGVTVEFPKITQERDIQSLIIDLIKEKGLTIDEKGIKMLTDYVGTDLSRLYNEIGKLTIVLPQGARITPEAIEKNIGISKDYNNYELAFAVANRDIAKSMQIIRYFSRSPKNNPWVMTLFSLFSLFSNTLLAFYSPRDDYYLKNALGIWHFNDLKTCKLCMQNYSASQVIEIIRLIRSTDNQGKGNGSRRNVNDLMEELIFNIFNAKGKL